MNADKGIKRQQRRLFIGQLLSFAGLFLVLGVIVFFLYERSIYQDIDHSLEQQKIMLTKPAHVRMAMEEIDARTRELLTGVCTSLEEELNVASLSHPVFWFLPWC